LKDDLLSLAVDVVQSAADGLSLWEIAMLLDVLKRIQANLYTKLDQAGILDDDDS